MSSNPIIYTPDKRPDPKMVVGVKISTLAAKSETNGPEFTMQFGDAGMGPPPHSHPWTEAFFVTKGTVEFTCDGKTVTCPTGSFVFIPPHTIHAFKFGPEGAEMLEITGAGSQASQLFTDLSAKLTPGPPDIPKVIQIFADNGAKVHL